MSSRGREVLYWLVLLSLLLPPLKKIKKTTTIRVRESTKEKISNLEFVKKDSYDKILSKLIEFYEDYKKINEDRNENRKKTDQDNE